MTREEAARLKPGDRVLVDHVESADHGTVVHATPRGGVLIHLDRGVRGWHPFNEVHRP